MQANDAKHRWHWIWPDPLGSLPELISVAAGTLWVSFLLLGALVAMLVARMPELRVPPWLAYAGVCAPFLLSGAVTIGCSGRWLRTAREPVVLVKRAAVLASACLLLAFWLPLCMASLFLEGELGGTEWLYGLARSALLWLCWVVGGLVVSLRKRPRPDGPAGVAPSHTSGG